MKDPLDRHWIWRLDLLVLQEMNCPRCGKVTYEGDVHTCNPPRPQQEGHYALVWDPQTGMPGIRCETCHKTSYSADDIKHRYCGHCKKYHEGMPHPNRDCFSAAGCMMVEHYLLHSGNLMRLVHADVKSSFPDEGTDGFVEHAWCEMPAIAKYEDGSKDSIVVVIDDTQPFDNMRIVPRDLYLEATQARNIQYFTFLEMFACCRFFGHDGPWDARNPCEKS